MTTVPLTVAGRIIRMGGLVLGTPGSASSTGTNSVSTLGTISGVVDWWDATTASGSLDGSGVALTQWAGAVVGGLASKVSGGSNLVAYSSYSGQSAALQGFGRRNGVLGGVGGQIVDQGVSTSQYLRWPALQQYGLLRRSAPIALSASADWCIAAAWSRPNLKQVNYLGTNSAAVRTTIIGFRSTPLLYADNAARSTVNGPDTGGLYVNGTKVLGTVAPRHTMTALLVNKANQGMTLYLNGSTAPVATGIACPFDATPGTLLIAGDDSDGLFGGAQVWFHEGMVGGSLTTAQISDIMTSSTKLGRYTTGSGKGLLIPLRGQSNLDYLISDGAFALMRPIIAYYSGALAVDAISQLTAPGCAMYTTAGNSYLTDAGIGTDPSAWATGSVGTSEVNVITGIPAIYQNDMRVDFTFYGESQGVLTDATRSTYATAEATQVAAVKRWLAVERAAGGGVSAAAFPAAYTAHMPSAYGSAAGVQMVSDSYATIAADPTQAVTLVLHNTADAGGRDGTGLSDGSSSHMRPGDYIAFGVRTAPQLARIAVAAGGAPATLPAPGTAGGIAVTGPFVSRAQFVASDGMTPSSSPTRYLRLTIQHDTGTALNASATALTGIGWTVRDGWSDPDNRGTSIGASVLAIVDATHLLVTLTGVPVNAVSACRLMYCETPVSGGGALGGVGSGNAVYDNASTLAQPTGFNISADLGPTYACNYPIGAIVSGMVIS